MNNLRLLTGLLMTALCSGGAAAYGQGQVMSIEEIFDIAEARSAQLRPVFRAVEEAERDVSVARAARLPEINAALSVSYIGDGFTTARDFSDRQKAPIPHLGDGFSVTLSQPLYTGGAISSGIELAELKSTAARYAADLKRDNIRLTLTGQYLDLYKCANLRSVVESNLAAARKVLDEMRSRYSQGTALKNDITRYELLVSNLELQLVKLDNTLDILNTSLVTTAGLPAGTVVVPDSAILARSLPVRDEAAWHDEAEECSPSLRLAATSLDISRKAERIVRAERLPKVGINAGWSIDGPILVEVPPINRNLSYWYVGVGVSYNLSSLYKSNRTVARSRAATLRAADELDAVREEVGLALHTDHVKYLEAYEELKTQRKSVELAVSNYRTVATRYSADMALITDLLDAANSRLDAEQRLVNARIDIIYYYYKLLFTSGKI